MQGKVTYFHPLYRAPNSSDYLAILWSTTLGGPGIFFTGSLIRVRVRTRDILHRQPEPELETEPEPKPLHP